MDSAAALASPSTDLPRPKRLPRKTAGMTRLVFLSDTHGKHHSLNVPAGDILVHAGDFCMSGKEQEARAFARWFESLPHPHKVVVAGNHDRCLELDVSLGKQIFQRAVYLFDQEFTVGGFRFYGSPWQPEFCDWAFNLPRGSDALRDLWNRIPDGLDVLVTHGPPHGILDACPDLDTACPALPAPPTVGPAGRRKKSVQYVHVGCELLREAVRRARPRLHVFGHIHEGYGQHHDPTSGTTFINASNCTGAYYPTNAPIVFDLPERGRA